MLLRGTFHHRSRRRYPIYWKSMLTVSAVTQAFLLTKIKAAQYVRTTPGEVCQPKMATRVLATLKPSLGPCRQKSKEVRSK